MSPGNADECLGCSLGQTSPQILPSHARIDKNRDGSNLDQTKGQDQKLTTGLHQQDHGSPALDTQMFEAPSTLIALLLQFSVCQGSPPGNQGRLQRFFTRSNCQMNRDIL